MNGTNTIFVVEFAVALRKGVSPFYLECCSVSKSPQEERGWFSLHPLIIQMNKFSRLTMSLHLDMVDAMLQSNMRNVPNLAALVKYIVGKTT